MQQYRMVKGMVTPPKCLFYAATQTEIWYTLIEQSSCTFGLVKTCHLLTPHSYITTS